jgi:hypothetical protein
VLTLYEPDEKWSLWKLRPRSKDNIKVVMKDVRRDLYWIFLSQHTDRLRDLVITIMNLSV